MKMREFVRIILLPDPWDHGNKPMRGFAFMRGDIIRAGNSFSCKVSLLGELARRANTSSDHTFEAWLNKDGRHGVWEVALPPYM